MGGYAQDLYPGHTYSRGGYASSFACPLRVFAFPYSSNTILKGQLGRNPGYAHTPLSLSAIFAENCAFQQYYCLSKNACVNMYGVQCGVYGMCYVYVKRKLHSVTKEKFSTQFPSICSRLIRLRCINPQLKEFLRHHPLESLFWSREQVCMQCCGVAKVFVLRPRVLFCAVTLPVHAEFHLCAREFGSLVVVHVADGVRVLMVSAGDIAKCLFINR